jgi:hypothetical protein
MNSKLRQRSDSSPSPLNGERAGVRGENVERLDVLKALPHGDCPHFTLSSPPCGSREGSTLREQRLLC